MRIKSLLVIISLFSFISVNGFGQQHTFIHYSSDEGLPQSQINDIVQDSSGFIWIATIGGLSRFDGKIFENYSTLNGLLQNEIADLAIDSENQLWMLGNLGLTSFNANSFQSFPFENKLNNLSKVYVDADTLWFASNVNLIQFYDNTFHFISTGLAEGNRIRAIQRDNNGDLWLLAADGAYNFSAIDFPNTRLNIPYANRALLVGKNSYISTYYDGIFKNFDEKAILSKDKKGDELYIKDIAIENDQKTIWIATGKELIKWNNESYSVITQRKGLDYPDINCLFIDRENVLWLGTNGNGLYKYLGDLITTYTTKDGLNSDLIMGVTEKNDHLFVINYLEGLNTIYNDTALNFPAFENEEKGKGWCLLRDSENVYVGFNYGLGVMNAEQNDFYPIDPNFLNNPITSLGKGDYDNSIFIGTRNGFTILKDGDEFNHFNNENGYPLGAVRAIVQRPDSSLWIASTNGLFLLKGTQLKSYIEESGLAIRNVYNVVSYNNMIWVGTSLGLFYFDGDTFHPYRFSSSPQDFSINCLMNDGLGRLWIGSNNGITAIMQNASGLDDIQHYGLQNGMKGLAINMNASFVDEEGNVFFGSESGLIRFDREKLETEKQKEHPYVSLTNLQLYLKDIDWSKRKDSLVNGSYLPVDLELEPKENYLTFYFAGINTRNPSNVRYRFMLLGAEGELAENWSNPSVNNFATFSNLNSGAYTFKVQASTNTQDWGTSFTSYSFRIKTPFYATWWFRTFIALVIGSVVYLIYLNRIRRMQQEQDNLLLRSQSKMLALEQQTLNANMNRHFVFNALNSIQYYLNKEDKVSANRYLSRFAKLIRKNLDSSQSKQTTLSEEIERMVLYMELEQMRFSHKFEFTFNVDPKINTREIKIPSMLFQPYLENSIWHGILPMEGEGRVDVHISEINEESIKISIFDNGIGIDTSMRIKGEQPRDHISVGMEITKNRLALYQQLSKSTATVLGPFEVKEDGKTIGTMVELTLPKLSQE